MSDEGQQVGDAVARRRYRTPVRGHAYAGPIPAEQLTQGRPLTLRREPHNPADELAIAVLFEDDDGRPWRIGYLDRTVAARLAPRLDAGGGVAASLDGWVDEPGGRWQRPLVRLDVLASEEAPLRSGVWGRPPGVRQRVVGRRDQEG